MTILSLLSLPWIFGIIIFLIVTGLRVIDQYERGVVLTLGKFTGTRKPGLTWIFAFLGIQRMIKVDLRIATVDIPQQEVITKDNVTVGINAVLYFRVDSAEKAVLEVQDFRHAAALYAQATLRDVIGGVELDVLLSERDKIAEEIKKIVDVATDPWGIDVSTIKIQDIELPADMKRVMAKQAEAERERRAKIINSEGEFQAAQKLIDAAALMATQPISLQLRYLQTLNQISTGNNSTTILPLPIDLFRQVIK